MLGVDDMEGVKAADAWNRLRLGITLCTKPGRGRGERVCILCSGSECGLGHVAGRCEATAEPRATFLLHTSASVRQHLRGAGPGSWQATVFIVSADARELGAAVRLGATIERTIRERT